MVSFFIKILLPIKKLLILELSILTRLSFEFKAKISPPRFSKNKSLFLLRIVLKLDVLEFFISLELIIFRLERSNRCIEVLV